MTDLLNEVRSYFTANKPMLHKIDVALVDEQEMSALMSRARESLKRFASRYASAPHAQAQVKEARLIVEEMLEWELRR